MTNEALMTPAHRLLLIVGELHKVGFERLRVSIGVGMLLRAHVFTAYDERVAEAEDWPAIREVWASVAFCVPYLPHDCDERTHVEAIWTALLTGSMRPRHLAGRFVLDFPELARGAYGPDQEYAHWYRRVVPLVLQDDAPYMYGDHGASGPPAGTLLRSRSEKRFPLPPSNPYLARPGSGFGLELPE